MCEGPGVDGAGRHVRMRRSRNALWLLLAGLAGSLLAVRGVAVPQRIAAPRPQPAGQCAPSIVVAERCSEWVLVHGPVAPIGNGREMISALCLPSPERLPEVEMSKVEAPKDEASKVEAISCPFLFLEAIACQAGDPWHRNEPDSAPNGPLDDDMGLACLSGACGGFADFSGATEPARRAFDWAGLCGDARHSAGAAEVLQLNEGCDGIGGAQPIEVPLDAVDLTLAVSRFSGPRPACVVSERATRSPPNRPGHRWPSLRQSFVAACRSWSDSSAVRRRRFWRRYGREGVWRGRRSVSASRLGSRHQAVPLECGSSGLRPVPVGSAWKDRPSPALVLEAHGLGRTASVR